MKKTTWIIEPQEPLIFRDGRPFGLNPGTRVTSLAFPFPSTVAGAARSQAGMNEEGIFTPQKEDLPHLKAIKVRGPLLVQLPNQPDQKFRWLLPIPSDLLLLKPEREAEEKEQQGEPEIILKRLTPLKENADTHLTDLSTTAQQELLLVGMSAPMQGKPPDNSPRYWAWDSFEKWLTNPDAYEGKPLEAAMKEHYEPQREERVHISMDGKTHTAIPGQLFETSGIEFGIGGKGTQRLTDAKRLALAIEVEMEENAPYEIQEGRGTLGSERRVVSWRRSTFSLPKCPEKLKDAIVEKEACRLLLLTPAYFKRGCIPELFTTDKINIQLKALTIARPQVVSGWDMEKNEPKETQRLAPAGTVFFLELKGNTKKTIKRWIDKIWMSCISDEQQWCNDGFGLAVVGSWNGLKEGK